MIKVKREKTALEQVRLHIIRAVADAVINHAVTLGPPQVPQVVPAGLGSSMPARARGDTSGSAIVQKLSDVELIAELTGAERDLKRVQGWQRALLALDMPTPVSANHANEVSEAKRVSDAIWKQARGDAKAALETTERYLKWLAEHLAKPPKEEDVRTKRQRDARRQLEQQHANRDRILSSARARVAATKARKARHEPRRRLPDPVYTVTVPALRITNGLTTWSIPTQRLTLDLRAGYRGEAQSAALEKAITQEAMPVSAHREGELRRAPRVDDAVWEAWETLSRGVQEQVYIKTEANSQSAA